MDKKKGIILIVAIVMGIIALFFDNNSVSLFKSLENTTITLILGVFEPMLFVLALMLLMAVLAFIAQKNWKIIVASPIIAGISAHIIKLIVMRPRPPGLVEYLPLPLVNIIDFSFPSAHVAAVFALLPVLNKEYPGAKALWWTLAIVVSLTRLYFSQHYLSDVIFGAVLGYFIGDLIISKKNKGREKKVEKKK